MKKIWFIIVLAAIVAGMFLMNHYSLFDTEEHVIAKAIAENNSSICEKMPLVGELERRTSICYQAYAKAKNDPEACNYPSPFGYDYKCYVDIKQVVDRTDVSICQKTHDQDYCYAEFAIRLQDLTICDTATDTYVIGSCYLKFEKKFPDIAICNKIPDAPQSLKNPNYFRDACFADYAEKTDPKVGHYFLKNNNNVAHVYIKKDSAGAYTTQISAWTLPTNSSENTTEMSGSIQMQGDRGTINIKSCNIMFTFNSDASLSVKDNNICLVTKESLTGQYSKI